MFQSGNCVFTFPNTPIKCAGAPQKVLYYGHDIVRDRGYRNSTNFIYATALPRVRLYSFCLNFGLFGSYVAFILSRQFQLFGVEAYLKSLNKIAAEKGIDVRTRHSLIEVDTKNKIAKFELLDEEAKPNGKFDEIPVRFFAIAVLPQETSPSYCDFSTRCSILALRAQRRQQYEIAKNLLMKTDGWMLTKRRCR